jgi:hypothetical protein
MFYVAIDVRILCTVSYENDAVECTFSPIQKLLMKAEHEHQDTYGESFFYTIYRIYFSYNYQVEKFSF